MRLALTCHPDTPCAAVQGIDVDVQRRDNVLFLYYGVVGEVAKVVLPAWIGDQRTDGLWKRTCFEAFVRVADNPAYVELNFAPTGQWASYRFEGYRAGMRAADDVHAHTLEMFERDERYELSAAADLHALGQATPWRVALSAVIEETSGAKSYWALAHPPGKPDFHHADSFAYELQP